MSDHFFDAFENKDERPKRLGWAPGGYSGICFFCNVSYIGDKRSSSCAPCAYGDTTKNNTGKGDL